jgi:glycosyltransferase involved in cell wall biosynthesis
MWLLYPDRIQGALLGPGVRILAISRHLEAQGHQVELVLGEGSHLPSSQSDARLHVLEESVLARIQPGDGLIVSGYLPGRILASLAARPQPFQADLYCTTATEIICHPMLGSIRLLRERRRRLLRYRLLVERAERIWVSNGLQQAFLGGLLYSSPRKGTVRTVDTLPQKCQEVPMGVSDEPFSTGNPWPYPGAMRNRRIFLWGGGIWNWFDVPTLLEAFALLQENGSSAALFFLGGRRLSGREEHERPIRAALEKASSLGILDRSVFFNERAAQPQELPGYLEHCVAGAMSNPASFESATSWRTRYLDLLWAGKPLVVSGSDPLAERMAASGGAMVSASGDPVALAGSIDKLCRDEALSGSLGAGSSALGERLRWSKVLSPLLSACDDPGSFSRTAGQPTLLWRARYKLGW